MIESTWFGGVAALIRFCRIGFSAFLLCLAAPAFAQFEQRASIAYEYPGPIAVGDFNGDGRLDIATAGAFDTQVTVLLGNGDGTFQQPVLYPAGDEPEMVATADLRRNGKLDLVVGNFLGGNVSVLLGNGDGTFQNAVNYALPGQSGGASWVGVGDFNGDGKPDIVAIDWYSACGGPGGCLAVFLGNGDGTFQAPPLVMTMDATPDEFVVGDFDNDGKLDLAVSKEGLFNTGLQIFLGNGDGTFRTGAFYPYWGRLATGRLTKGGNLDLVASSDALHVFLGNGDGTFQGPNTYPPFTGWVTIGDFTGDGIPDIAATEDYAGGKAPREVFLYVGNGDGTFQPAIPFGTPREPGFIHAGDFNGDHKPDIVFADGRSGAYFITTMLNTGAAYFSPDTPLSFGKQTVGTTSNPQTITLTNTGKSALTISAMKASAEFGVTSTCGSKVAAGAKCSIGVTFTPTSMGAKSGTVSIRDSASSKPQVIELFGTGD